MSDEEKVARAIIQAHFAAHSQSDFGYPHAAAAIAAVAEWLEIEVGTPSAYVTAYYLRKQLEAKE